MILPVSLTAVGLAGLINIWLGMRCGQVRMKEKINIGDGGNDLMQRRMRAHANFIEYTPIFLGLVLVLELALGTSMWLWIVMGLYMLARVSHGLGMDKDGKLREIGILVTMLATLGLALYAIAIPHISAGSVEAADTETVPVG